MMTNARRAAAVVVAVACTVAPRVAAAQRAGAQVTLTVIVPPRASAAEQVRELGGSEVRAWGANYVEVSALAGIAAKRATRVDVRLADDALASGVRVLARRSDGALVPLREDDAVTVVARGECDATAPNVVVLRVESDSASALGAIAVPVTYRLTVGKGETASRWSYTTTVALRGER